MHFACFPANMVVNFILFGLKSQKLAYEIHEILLTALHFSVFGKVRELDGVVENVRGAIPYLLIDLTLTKWQNFHTKLDCILSVNDGTFHKIISSQCVRPTNLNTITHPIPTPKQLSKNIHSKS